MRPEVSRSVISPILARSNSQQIGTLRWACSIRSAGGWPTLIFTLSPLSLDHAVTLSPSTMQCRFPANNVDRSAYASGSRSLRLLRVGVDAAADIEPGTGAQDAMVMPQPPSLPCNLPLSPLVSRDLFSKVRLGSFEKRPILRLKHIKETNVSS